MFFKQISKNAKKTREENGLYFGSLIVAIVSFYVLLSLEDQDVISFLKTIESGAISKLMILIKLVYIISLFILFFLIYFSSKYHLERRKKEFGMYQMLGMRRSKIFSLLMGETVYNSLISLVIGLPIALFLTEIISLTTVKLIGLNIIEHSFKFSLVGIVGTIIGFLIVQLLSMFLLSIAITKKEPIELIKKESSKKQVMTSKKGRTGFLVLGSILLIITYFIAIKYMKNLEITVMALILFIGSLGTFLLFKGLSSLIGEILEKRLETSTGLFTFTMRQVQENVFFESNTLAFSSLLILIAMVCVAFGLSLSLGNTNKSIRSVDFSITSSKEEAKGVVKELKNNSYIDGEYEINLSSLYGVKDKNEEFNFSWGNLREKISELSESENKESLLNNLEYNDYPYLIPLSSVNNMLAYAGKEEIVLKDNEIALYSNEGSRSKSFMKEILEKGVIVNLDNKEYKLLNEFYNENIVADRSITLSLSLIVTDDLYDELIETREYHSWNLSLDDNSVEEKGLMQAIKEVNDILDENNIYYESYLQGIGRNVFYTIAGSYLTLYLGVIFLIIGNTMIGIKFLIQLSKSKSRYKTLLNLGSTKEQVNKSSKAQVRIFFGLVLSVSLVSSIFGVWAMFNSFISSGSKDFLSHVAPISAAIIIMVLVVELIYIKIIDRSIYKEINSLNEFERS